MMLHTMVLAILALLAAAPAPLGAQSHAEARARIQQGDFASAERVASALVGADREDAEGWYLLGVSRGGLGRVSDAIEAYRRAVALKPALADAWNNLGDLLRRTGEFDQALEAMNRALEIEPGHPQATLNSGMTYLQVGDFEQAVHRLEAAVRAFGEQFLITYSLARAHIELGDYRSAEPYLLRFRTSPPPGFAGFGELSTFLVERGAYRQAAELLMSVPEGSRNPAMQLMLGQAWVGLDRPADGYEVLRRLADAAPSTAGLHLWLGYAARGIGRHGEARDAFRSALEREPRSAAAMSALGSLTLETGSAEDALVWLDRALEVDPASSAARIEKAVALSRLDRHDEVIALLDPLPEERSELHRALYLLALAYRQVGDLDRAATTMERFRELDRRIRTEEGRTPGRVRVR